MIGLAQDLVRPNARPPSGIVVRQATDEADVHRITAMESQVWGEDLSWLDDDLLVWLRGGSTLAFWRRRGIYQALVARRAELAVTRGVRYLHVGASENNRPILERLGFVAVTTTTSYV